MTPPAENHKPNFWLVKFAPFRTSWAEIIRRGTFTIRGVRSPEARKHLKAMRPGEPVFFYQSQIDQAIVGLMHVSREAYPDPCSADPQWVTCDFRPLKTLTRPLPMAELRHVESLANLPLLTQPRLAVMPITSAEFETIQTLETVRIIEGKT